MLGLRLLESASVSGGRGAPVLRGHEAGGTTGKVSELTSLNEELLRGVGDAFTGVCVSMVFITDLVINPMVRLNGVDNSHVALLAEIADPPPIVVHRPSMVVIDGVHRVLATLARGGSQIGVTFFDGSVEDAFLLAVQLNRAHGLPLSRKDRRNAVVRMLLAHPEWSDRRLAAVAGVSPKTVASVRRAGESEDSVRGAGTNSGVRIGRDGRTRPTDAAGGRLRAYALLNEDPQAPTRKIAASAGVSPSTVSDIRRRMREGSDPVAPRRGAGPGPAIPTADEEPASLLERLGLDPSLRSTLNGRTLLRVLRAQAGVLVRMDEMARAVPAHRTGHVALLGRLYADAWSQFADELERAGLGGRYTG
jgi:hypothetical protein